jgi:hypothetical protein
MTWRFHKGQGMAYFRGSRPYLIAITPFIYVPLTSNPLSVSSQYTLFPHCQGIEACDPAL